MTPSFSRRLRRVIGTLLLACAAVVVAHAQQGQFARTPPHIGYVYPAGGKQGTIITVSVGGQNLNGTNEAFFTGAGVNARVTGFDRPLTQKEFNDLREKQQELLQRKAAAFGLPAPERFEKKAEKKGLKETDKPEKAAPAPSGPRPKWTAADEQQLADIRTRLLKRPNRQGNPALAETVTLEVSIAADAVPGSYELRLKSPTGISNPMVVQVGELAEFVKPVVTATSNPAPITRRDPSQQRTRAQPADAEIALPAIVNGQILPGEVDRYRFPAKKGQRLTVAVSARALIPYLADAVPGWFQATLALYDPQGHEVAYSDSFRFSPDPVVNFEIPQDGTYAIEIKDSIYRGREDFVYRVAIGELPFLTSIFPLGGRLSETAKFQLSGWNLPGNAVAMDTKDKATGQFLLSVRSRGQLSNTVRFALDGEQSCLETEPNDTPAKAQKLMLPIVVDGRIQSAGDTDVFQFDGKAGEEVVAEVFARRLGSPLDSVLKVTDAAGNQLAFNDDTEDKGVGLMTHHADSRVMLKLPADGTYAVTLADAQHHGGPEYGYRLRVSAPRPDYELRVVPSTINMRGGTHAPITVYALRRDGFSGEIVLSLQNAPRGFALAGARIPAGQDKVQLTLSAPPIGGDELVKLTLLGAAMINGQPVGRVAVPAEDMMQAFAYHHLVPTKEWLVDVTGRPGAACRLLTRPPVQLPAGGTARILVSATVGRAMGKVAVELNDPPEGITITSSEASGDRVEVVVSCDPAKVKAGLKGNLVLNAFADRAGEKTKGPRPQRIPLGSLPAIPFEVTAPVAKN